MDSVIIVDFGDSVKGECTLAGYEGKVQATGYSHDIFKSVSNDAGSNARASGKPFMGELHISKFVDKASPSLYQACCEGTGYKKVIITVVNEHGAGKPAPTTVITLTSVIVASVSAGSDGGLAKEHIALNYIGIGWEQIEKNKDGGKTGTSSASYDQQTGKAVAA